MCPQELWIPSPPMCENRHATNINPHSHKRKIAPRPIPTSASLNGLPSPSSSRAKSSIKNLLPRLSFKFKNSTSGIEKAAILALGESSAEVREKSFVSRSPSLTKIFSSKIRKTSSLPVTPIAHLNPESMHGRSMIDPMASASSSDMLPPMLARKSGQPRVNRRRGGGPSQTVTNQKQLPRRSNQGNKGKRSKKRNCINWWYY